MIDNDKWKPDLTQLSLVYDNLLRNGLIICPTKVGYILVAQHSSALERKFMLKKRPIRKSAVLLTNYSMLLRISVIPKDHRLFIEKINNCRILCGFILKRKKTEFNMCTESMNAYTMQPNKTSCFVINHGAYSEKLVMMASQENHYLFASSANISGTGNKGRFSNIATSITKATDFCIEDDAYVSQRYADEVSEQGVMVDLCSSKPVVIRLGLYSDVIINILRELYGPSGYSVCHGSYP